MKRKKGIVLFVLLVNNILIVANSPVCIVSGEVGNSIVPCNIDGDERRNCAYEDTISLDTLEKQLFLLSETNEVLMDKIKLSSLSLSDTTTKDNIKLLRSNRQKLDSLILSLIQHRDYNLINYKRTFEKIGVDVKQSNDKKVVAYSWCINYTSGGHTDIYFKSYLQINSSNNESVLIYFPFYDDSLFSKTFEPTNIEFLVDIDINGNSCYIICSSYTAESISYYFFQVITLNNNNAPQRLPCFEEESDKKVMAVSTPKYNEMNIKYNKELRILSYNKHPEFGSSNKKIERVVYQLENDVFIKISK